MRLINSILVLASMLFYWAAAENFAECAGDGPELSCVVIKKDECLSARELGRRRANVRISVRCEREVRVAMIRATQCRRLKVGDKICVIDVDNGDMVACDFPACSYAVLWIVVGTIFITGAILNAIKW